MVLVLDQFVRSLRESRLIPAEEVVSLQKALQASKTPRTVEEVAKLLVQNGKLTAYQAATISQGRPQSLILGEYVLLDILGKGGMGVVFRARHRLMDRVVALKTLPTAVIKPDSIQRFYREVKAAARLSHPNIVTAYDAGEQAGTHYLVMEYVVGRDLAAIVKEQGPLPLRQAIDYMRQAARGLDYAHKHGVIHRDVKPSNLLLDQEGVVKILDMGLARLSENLADAPAAIELTGTGQILGTVDYMSPEQAEDVRAADHRSDIYSLGCTLFFLLTRRAAYGGETIVRRILAHRDEPIPSVAAIRPDCPEALDAAIQWMLAKRPDDRPQSMAEIMVALEGCLETPDAAPPLAGPSSARSDAGNDWLENLVHEDAAPSTEDSQARDATLASAAADDLHYRPPSARAGGSSIGRSKPHAHRPGAKKSVPAAGRKTWKIAAAAAAAAVIIAAAAVALIHSQAGSDTTASANPKNSGISAGGEPKPAGSAAPAAQPVPMPPVAAWEAAWADAKVQADRLVAQQHFGMAIHQYAVLAERFPDPLAQQRCHEAIRRVRADADSAFREVETVVRQYLRRRQFAQARMALQPVLTGYAPVLTANRAAKLLEEIDLAQSQAAEKPPAIVKPAAPAISAELLRQRQLDATFAEAMRAVEGRVADWDFQRAVQESQKVRFDAPELTARLALRREQIRRMADLKDRMIARVNRPDSTLTKTDLDLRGINGEVNKADEEGITATLPSGRQESLAWPGLGPKAMHNLLARVVRREDAGDSLAAGLLSLVGQDVAHAEQHFDRAQVLGAETAPYLALLAARDFVAIRDLLDKHQYAEGESRLAALEQKYGKLPWFAANKPELDAAANEARRGLREKEAETLYTQAAGLFHLGDLYELKPVVEQFNSQYADSNVAADPQRKPSLAEMQKAVADLGPLVRVRKDGKGDAKTIQQAVNQAAGNAMIQIEEAGPWAEQIMVPAEKDGLTIRGKRGLLPVITTAGAKNTYSEALLVQSPQLSLERLEIVRADTGGPLATAVTADKTALCLRGVVVYGHLEAGSLDSQHSVCVGSVRTTREGVAKDSVFMGHVAFRTSSSLQNVLICTVASGLNCGPASRLRHCTITGPLHLAGWTGTVSDCIVYSVNTPNEGHTIEHCDVFGDPPYLNHAAPGTGCLKTLPLFADPKSIDFRLQAGSPCRKAASDGSDMGFSYTTEIQPLLKVAIDRWNRAHAKF